MTLRHSGTIEIAAAPLFLYYSVAPTGFDILNTHAWGARMPVSAIFRSLIQMQMRPTSP
jgi:hypothetical protein